MVKGPSATKRKHKTLPPSASTKRKQNASTKRKHQTLPLMGATRPASGIKAKLTGMSIISAICEPLLSV